MIESHCHIAKSKCLVDGQAFLFEDYMIEEVSQENWVVLTQALVHFSHQLF